MKSLAQAHPTSRQQSPMTLEPVLVNNTRYTVHPNTLMLQKEEASKKGKVTCPQSVTRSGL